jgi:hypothetical protein
MPHTHIVIFSIEQNLSAEDRERHKYWVVVNGRRYLRIEETDETHFKKYIPAE